MLSHVASPQLLFNRISASSSSLRVFFAPKIAVDSCWGQVISMVSFRVRSDFQARVDVLPYLSPISMSLAESAPAEGLHNVEGSPIGLMAFHVAICGVAENHVN